MGSGWSTRLCMEGSEADRRWGGYERWEGVARHGRWSIEGWRKRMVVGSKRYDGMREGSTGKRQRRWEDGDGYERWKGSDVLAGELLLGDRVVGSHLGDEDGQAGLETHRGVDKDLDHNGDGEVGDDEGDELAVGEEVDEGSGGDDLGIEGSDAVTKEGKQQMKGWWCSRLEGIDGMRPNRGRHVMGGEEERDGMAGGFAALKRKRERREREEEGGHVIMGDGGTACGLAGWMASGEWWSATVRRIIRGGVSG